MAPRERIAELERQHPETIPDPMETPSSPALTANDTPRQRVTRQNRKPFGSVDQKLAWPLRPGYHNHWFNDEPGRIYQAKEAGYEHVNDHRGTPVSRVVGVTQGGDPLLAYLMEIPQEWWEEDIANQQRIVDEKMTAIRRGAVEIRTPQDSHSFYAGSDRGQIDIRDSFSKRDSR